MFNKTIDWEYIIKSPAKPIKSLKKPLKQPRFLYEAEIRQLIENSENPLKTAFKVALYIGFRVSEVYNLQWNDIDFDKNAISVNAKTTLSPKSYEFLTIPLNNTLKQYLLEFNPPNAKPNDYLFEKISMNRRHLDIKRALRKAKIKNATFHTLRHTFASRRVIKGVSIFTVLKLLGHSDIKTTMIYARLSKEHLANSVNLLEY